MTFDLPSFLVLLACLLTGLHLGLDARGRIHRRQRAERERRENEARMERASRRCVARRDVLDILRDRGLRTPSDHRS